MVIDAKTVRTTTAPIGDIFLERWSPRALSGEALSDEEVKALFEAARWAPSSYNNQPWRFVIATKDSPEWGTIFGLLGEFNQSWCKQASLLAVVISSNKFAYNGEPSPTHSYDTGSAWMSLALEASRRGLVAHGMQGFDYARAKTELKIPDDYTVEAMFAVGKHGKKEDLSAELQAKEQPSDRNPISEFVFKGAFGQRIF